jgi:hypothetical protein
MLHICASGKQTDWIAIQFPPLVHGRLGVQKGRKTILVSFK